MGRSMATERSGESGTQQGIKSIEIGSRVLLALEQGRGPMTLTEVARASGLHPAKAHRYLTSLVRTGLASQDATTQMYDLGPASRHLGVEALRRVDSVRTASNFAVELRDETGHTVNLAVWSDSGPVLVGWDTGTHVLPIVVRIGSTLPMLDSVVGYLFLAHLPKTVTAAVIKAQQKQGATRQMTAAQIEELRRESREAPFVRTGNQMILGLAALGAPVFGADGQIELTMGMVLPARMVTERDATALGKRLRAAADRTSRELGYDPER